jgi:hypothetical protein
VARLRGRRQSHTDHQYSFVRSLATRVRRIVTR